MNLQLNDNHDIFISGRSMARHEGTPYTAQTVKCNLLFQEGEWVIDRTAGIPWLTGALEKGVPLQLIINLITVTIQRTTGVLSVDSVEFDRDKTTRRLIINYTATTVFGKQFSRSIS